MSLEVWHDESRCGVSRDSTARHGTGDPASSDRFSLILDGNAVKDNETGVVRQPSSSILSSTAKGTGPVMGPGSSWREGTHESCRCFRRDPALPAGSGASVAREPCREVSRFLICASTCLCYIGTLMSSGLHVGMSSGHKSFRLNSDVKT
jgi:hypothetical protein